MPTSASTNHQNWLFEDATQMKALYSSDQIIWCFLAQGWKFRLVRRKALLSHRKALSVRFKNVHSDWSCTPSTVNVFRKRYNAAWPFRGEPSSDQAVPTAAMCSVKKHSQQVSGHCCKYQQISHNGMRKNSGRSKRMSLAPEWIHRWVEN
jgi:hypothetical protein